MRIRAVRTSGDVLRMMVRCVSSMSRACRTLKDATEMGHDLGKVLLDKGARKVLGLGGADTVLHTLHKSGDWMMILINIVA